MRNPRIALRNLGILTLARNPRIAHVICWRVHNPGIRLAKDGQAKRDF